MYSLRLQIKNYNVKSISPLYSFMYLNLNRNNSVIIYTTQDTSVFTQSENHVSMLHNHVKY